MKEAYSAAEGRMGRVVVIRLKPGADLLGGIQEACEKYFASELESMHLSSLRHIKYAMQALVSLRVLYIILSSLSLDILLFKQSILI